MSLGILYRRYVEAGQVGMRSPKPEASAKATRGSSLILPLY